MAVTKIHGARQVQDQTITNAQISATAAIALSKLAAVVIQAGGAQAFTADQSMGGFRLTNVAAPTAATDAANKAYVDGLATGVDWKASVRAATTAAGALATDFANASIVDGVTLATGDRILIKNQATGSENGIYTVNATGSPTRATDADSSTEVSAGMAVFVEAGTTNADTGWLLTTDGAITLGTTALVFTQFTGIGSLTAGNGLVRTGNTVDAVGTAGRIVVNADSIDIGTDVVTLAGVQTLTNKSISGGQITSAVANATNANTAAVSNALKSATTTIDVAAATAPTAGQILTATSGTAATWQSPAASPIFVDKETPANGTTVGTDYVLAFTPVAGSEHVYVNGILQDAGTGNDYTISGAAITMLSPLTTGDKIRVSYRR